MFAHAAATLPDDLPYWQQVTVWTLRNLYVWMMLLAILGWSQVKKKASAG